LYVSKNCNTSKQIKMSIKFLTFLSFLNVCCFSHANDEKNKKEFATDTSDGFAVVELFTSEGCSSCPPADAAVAKLINDFPEKVYVLGFHVDYWDHLGWKDNYSSEKYSERQEHYANVFHLNSVYTPQAIVNGAREFVGSDERKMYGVVQEDLHQKFSSYLKLTTKDSDKRINIHFETNADAGNQLNIALIQEHAETKVMRGENQGRTLNHVNVVRDFKTVDVKGSNGDMSLQLPEGMNAKDFVVIGFVQSGTTLKINAADEAKIE
jgi:hypothetical protein